MTQKREFKCGVIGLRRTLGLLLASLLVLCLQSCQPSKSVNPRTQLAVSETNQHYYFVMEENRQRVLLQKVSQLKVGDLRTEVIKQLGSPSYDRLDATKEGRALGRSVMYYLRIWEKDLVNEKHDRFILLEFNMEDRLTRILKRVEDTP